MVINIELIDGALIEYKDKFYSVLIEDHRATIKELFTGLSVRDSLLESDIMREIMVSIEKQTATEDQL